MRNSAQENDALNNSWDQFQNANFFFNWVPMAPGSPGLAKQCQNMFRDEICHFQFIIHEKNAPWTGRIKEERGQQPLKWVHFGLQPILERLVLYLPK